jgi:hypothetical protein
MCGGVQKCDRSYHCNKMGLAAHLLALNLHRTVQYIVNKGVHMLVLSEERHTLMEREKHFKKMLIRQRRIPRRDGQRWNGYVLVYGVKDGSVRAHYGAWAEDRATRRTVPHRCGRRLGLPVLILPQRHLVAAVSLLLPYLFPLRHLDTTCHSYLYRWMKVRWV